MAPIVSTDGDSRRECLKVDTEGEDLRENEEILVKEISGLDLGCTMRKMSLAGLGLEEVPSHLARLEFLTELNLSGNKLDSLPTWFRKLCRLRELDLSNNQFKSLPSVLAKGLHLLKELDLSCNKLVECDERPACLAHLKILKLGSNSLRSPPAWLFSETPSSLEFLDLSLNSYLCSEPLPKLEEGCIAPVCHSVHILNLSESRLFESHSAFINNFSQVRSLNLGNRPETHMPNSFQSIPTNILPLANTLEQLDIQNVGLPTLEDSISSFIHLQVLNMSSNVVNWLPASICLLSKLQICRISNCRLYFLPNDFGNLSSLTQLYLDGNELTSLPDSFVQLQNLEVLDLYCNHLSSMPELSSAKSLKALDISQNNFDPPDSIEVNGHCMRLEDLRRKLTEKNRLTVNRSMCRRESISDISCGDYSREISDGNLSEDSSSENSYALSEPAPNTQKNNEDEESSSENWDIDNTNDDHFVPGVLINRVATSSSDESDYCVPNHIKNSQHFFCPYRKQQHFWGTKKQFQSHEEGQFDDC